MRYMESEEKTQSHTQRECFTKVLSRSHVTLFAKLSRNVELLLNHTSYIHTSIISVLHKYYIYTYISTYVHPYIHQKIQVTFVYLIGDDDRECAWETESAKE